MNNKISGDIGEALVYDYLVKNKYKILQCNFKCKIGEIDIIAKQNDVIVFVEVKYRKSLQFGSPSEAVNFYKQKKIKSVALYYLQQNKNLNENVRFDVVEVLDKNINHIKNAF